MRDLQSYFFEGDKKMKPEESNPKKAFVVSEDVVKEVCNTLKAFIDHVDGDCAASGCMCDLRGEACSYRISSVLHDFESSLCVHQIEEGTL
jgi:hypothetical protein